MRKLLSIPLVMLLLFSGVKVNIARHYCGGNFVASNVSFSGKTAGCGMENNESNSDEFVFKNHCCENVLNSYTLDNNYFPSAASLADAGFHFTVLKYVPAGIAVQRNFYPENLLHTIKPPGTETTVSPNDVEREVICIFLI